MSAAARKVHRRIRDLNRLLSQERYLPTTLMAASREISAPGCYIIWDKRDKNRPLYIGMAKTMLSARLKKHILRGQTSFRNYLAHQTLRLGDIRFKSPEGRRAAYRRINQWISGHCEFQVLAMNDPTEADLLEKFALSVLVPSLQYPDSR